MTTSALIVGADVLAPGGANDAVIRAAGWTPTVPPVVVPPPPPPPSVLNPLSRWQYTAAVGPANPHEQPPNNPPFWSWHNNGETPNPKPPAGVGAFTGWGQIYLAAGATASSTVEFEIDDMRSWLVSSNGLTWTVVQHNQGIGGSSPSEDWTSGTTLTIKPGSLPTSSIISFTPGHLGHFWPGGARPAIPAGFQGFAACAYRVRMIGSGDYVANAGADWWQTTTSGPNPEATQARFCRVPTDGSWMAVDAYSGSVVVTVPSTW